LKADENMYRMKILMTILCFTGLSLSTVVAQEQSALHPDSVMMLMNRVCRWQINEWKEGRIIRLPKTEWENAVLYTGIVALQDLARNEAYDQFLYQVGEECQWNTGPVRLFADDYCIAQLYTAMYRWHKERKMIAAWRLLADTIVNRRFDESLEVVPKINHREWAWCDALYMGPASLAALSKVTGKQKYLRKADTLWWKTSAYLYSVEDSLFYRDSRFFSRREAGGQKVFWSRGNAWVLAGLARIMDHMPGSFKHRDKYVQQFKEMAAKIAGLQQADSSWHASLYDPVTFNVKESSATALFCYGLAWGINQGLLPRNQYLPVVQKAWGALVTCLHPDGKLGYVQNVGDKPVSPTYESTNVYGVGGFLLAGSEIFKMNLR
jgi:rhamnogalacturonyl hydrolase YesR